MLLLLAAAAFACPVCGQPLENNQTNYLVMTIVLSLLPLGMMGGVGFWVYRSTRSAHAPGAPGVKTRYVGAPQST